MISRRTRRTWLRLRPEYKELLDKLVDLYVDLTGGATNSGVIEMALKALAARHGLSVPDYNDSEGKTQ